MGIIYKVTNLINGKVYIGQTCTSLLRRKKSHYDHARKYKLTVFHKALMKYSESEFTWEILISNIIDKNTLNILEIKMIMEHNSYGVGYNMTRGGDGGATYFKGDPVYNRIKHKLAKWPDGNPGATPEAIKKRINTFKSVTWVSGKDHGNYGHSHNKGCCAGDKNPMFGKCPANARKVVIAGVRFESIAAASRHLLISGSLIKKRCLDINNKEYNYV